VIGSRSMGAIRPSRRIGLLLLILLTLVVAGCGTKQVTVTGANGQATTETVKNIHFANTKFVLHVGLAFGAFHHYIYTPLRSGELRRGAPHRLATLAKGALAAAFVVHELRIAREDAQSSNQLRPLLVKLDNLESRIEGLIPGLKSGTASTTAISGASSATSSLGSASNGLGLHIRDIVHGI
jgi:hypothetical protein